MGLFFPPLEQSLTTITDCVKEETATWELLQQKDPARAKLIDKNDTYRIMRALQLCHQSLQPSQLQPLYNPIEGKALIVFITRDRNELYKRINERVESMIQQGWIQEVFSLIGTKWENFLERKKLIGYTDILHFITKENSNPNAYKKMIESIQQKTRHYAKRQETFWRMLVKKMSVVAHPPEMHLCNISVEEGRKKLEIIFKHFIA